MEKHCRVVLCAAIFFFVTSGCLASPRIDEHPGRHWQCSETEFQCTSGQCVRIGALCDGDTDCDDKSDEEFCTFSNTENSLVNFVQRSKRQTARKCGKSKWTCRNGDCIAIDGKCDGAVDCQDGSDESYATCRNIKCPTYLFRCAYGACVDTTAKCDNVQDCRDNSDELNLDCKPRKASTKCGKRFECDDGKCIAPYERCDGVVNCADGSDETVLQCSKEVCPSYLFRCAYGACVDRGSDCNQIIECADGSDESYDLCNTAPPTTTEKPTTAAPTKPPFSGNGCIVPPLSAGNYKVETSENYSPGDEVPIFTVITFNCGSGSSLPGNQNVTYCIGPNSWSSEPVCKRKCRALQSVSVSFKCSAPDGKILPCDVPVEVGTIARPTCKNSYIHRDILPQLKCLEGGSWDNTASCTPDCGTITPKGQTLIVNGRTAEHGEFPWHVGIFEVSDGEPSGYVNICGGSIVNAVLVISAAHCFYIDGDGLKPAERYAVAAGKLHRSWDSPDDDVNFVQKSLVKKIYISQYYGGITRNYQADFALLELNTLFTFSSIVKPVCIDYDLRLEQLQLVKGEYGKVPGWGLLEEDGLPSEILKTANLPFVPYPDCVASLPVTFQPFLLTDKICAGWTNGTAVCKGDSGGGLVFNRTDNTNIMRFYLRGIVSNSPLNDAKTSCRSDNYAAFTKVSAYSDFITEVWSSHQPT